MRRQIVSIEQIVRDEEDHKEGKERKNPATLSIVENQIQHIIN